MTAKEAYLDFRKHIDAMAFPELEKLFNVSKELDDRGNVKAFLWEENGYIDALWVEESCRGNGIGYRLVIKHIFDYGMPDRLHILNNNQKAIDFWNKVFVLEKVESNNVDTLYEILKLRDTEVRQWK